MSGRDGSNAMVACPSCNYDLSGLPVTSDVRCPECGKPVPSSEPLAPPPPGPASRRFPESAGVLAVVLGLCWSVPMLDGPRGGEIGIVLWPVVLIIGVHARNLGRTGRWASVLIACAACASMLGIHNWRGETLLSSVVLRNLVPLSLWAGLWAVPPRSSIATSLLLLALAPGVPGVVLLADTLETYNRRGFWMGWEDPRPGYAYEQWPMDVYGGMLWSTVLLGAAAALVASAAVAAHRAIGAKNA